MAAGQEVVGAKQAMPVDVVDPLVSRLPYDGPDPQAQVGRHQVHEAEPGEEAEPLHDHLEQKYVAIQETTKPRTDITSTLLAKPNP